MYLNGDLFMQLNNDFHHVLFFHLCSKLLGPIFGELQDQKIFITDKLFSPLYASRIGLIFKDRNIIGK